MAHTLDTREAAAVEKTGGWTHTLDTRMEQSCHVHALVAEEETDMLQLHASDVDAVEQFLDDLRRQVSVPLCSLCSQCLIVRALCFCAPSSPGASVHPCLVICASLCLICVSVRLCLSCAWVRVCGPVLRGVVPSSPTGHGIDAAGNLLLVTCNSKLYSWSRITPKLYCSSHYMQRKLITVNWRRWR